MDNQTENKATKALISPKLKKQIVAEYKAGANIDDLAKKYSVGKSSIYTWQKKIKNKMSLKRAAKKKGRKSPQGKHKPHDSEKELLRRFMVDTLANRFRKSIENQSAAALIEISKGMTEKGL